MYATKLIFGIVDDDNNAFSSLDISVIVMILV
jgi:hypothetical protein